MLKQSGVFSGFAVNDVQAAATFCKDILGLEVAVDDAPMAMLRLKLPSGATVLVYPKPNHVPAKFTILNFPVDDIEQAVTNLENAGIETIKYSGEMGTDERGIFRKGGPLIAWFKDPSGNILSVLQTI